MDAVVSRVRAWHLAAAVVLVLSAAASCGEPGLTSGTSASADQSCIGKVAGCRVVD